MRAKKPAPPLVSPIDAAQERKKALGERPRIEVRTYILDQKGRLEEISCYPLEAYGSCPNVGDTLLTHIADKMYFYSVQRRYFVEEGSYYTGWALILREIEPVGPPLQVWEEWQEATEFWDDVAQKEEEEFTLKLQERISSVIDRNTQARKAPASKPRKGQIRRKPTGDV